LCVSAMVVIGCAFTEPERFDARQLQRTYAEEAARSPTYPLGPLPQTLPDIVPEGAAAPRRYAGAPWPATTMAVPMTLQQVIHRTVVNSLDVRVASYQAAIDEVRILEAEANFDPTLFAGATYQKQYPQGVFPQNLDPFGLYSMQTQAGIRQRLPSGGQIEARAQSSRYRFESRPFVFNPATTQQTVWDDQLVLQITQPLLQNFGTEVNRARITIARNDFRISQLEWRDQLEKTLQQAEEAYWRLVQAQADVRIQEQLLRQTEDTRDIIVKRRGHDTSDLQVYQAQASVEQRNAQLVRARGRVRELSNQLKRLMNDPELPVAGPHLIEAVDRPAEQPVKMVVSDLIETALQNRLELLQQQLRIDSARTIIKAARSNALPQLNLVGSVGIQGLGTDFKAALDDLDDTGLLNYSIGIQFEVPIGNRQARAIYQRTLLQHQQAIDQYRALADQVAMEVMNARNEVETSWSEIVAARDTRFAAEKALRAIEDREQQGEPLSPTFVQLKLDRQSALAEAWRQELQALANYNIALSALEKAKGTLLKYNNVLMKELQGPAVPGGAGR